MLNSELLIMAILRTSCIEILSRPCANCILFFLILFCGTLKYKLNPVLCSQIHLWAFCSDMLGYWNNWKKKEIKILFLKPLLDIIYRITLCCIVLYSSSVRSRPVLAFLFEDLKKWKNACSRSRSAVIGKLVFYQSSLS